MFKKVSAQGIFLKKFCLEYKFDSGKVKYTFHSKHKKGDFL